MLIKYLENGEIKEQEVEVGASLTGWPIISVEFTVKDIGNEILGDYFRYTLASRMVKMPEAETKTDEQIIWWDSLWKYPNRPIRIFPIFEGDKNSGQYYQSVQCPGCFMLMTPADDVKSWIIEHFEHREQKPFYQLDPLNGPYTQKLV